MTNHSFILTIRQNEDCETMSKEDIKKAIKHLLEEGVFLEVINLNPVQFISTSNEKENNEQ